MGKLFGTDGIRGIANTELSCELAFAIGRAGALVLTNAEVRAPRILIGRDTRVSGKMLQQSMTAGICSVGAQPVDIGVLPTPGVAYLVREHEADAAVVISASHNSFEYNGIKWFSSDGYKLSDALEERIEALIEADVFPFAPPTGANVGVPVKASNAAQYYIDYLVSCCENDISKIKIVLDCANGAASNIATEVFGRLNASYVSYFNQPDGCNINAHCGATHVERLQQLVVEHGADVGFAFDGDADRMMAVDEHGVLVDGDRVMGICALDRKERGKLQNETIVVTVMSNIGLKLTMKEHDIAVEETDVGDRYVIERLRACGHGLGGEQSGHVVFPDKSTTGDGMLSAIELLNVMARKREKLSNLAKQIKLFPQLLVNVRVPREQQSAWKDNEIIGARIAEAEAKMAGRGRVLVRASGTEPLLRVMIEGEDREMVAAETTGIAAVIAEQLGGTVG